MMITVSGKRNEGAKKKGKEKKNREQMTYPSMIIDIEIKTDHSTALRFSRRACIKVWACSSSVACLACKMASWPNFSSRSWSTTFWWWLTCTVVDSMTGR